MTTYDTVSQLARDLVINSPEKVMTANGSVLQDLHHIDLGDTGSVKIKTQLADLIYCEELGFTVTSVPWKTMEEALNEAYVRLLRGTLHRRIRIIVDTAKKDVILLSGDQYPGPLTTKYLMTTALKNTGIEFSDQEEAEELIRHLLKEDPEIFLETWDQKSQIPATPETYVKAISLMSQKLNLKYNKASMDLDLDMGRARFKEYIKTYLTDTEPGMPNEHALFYVLTAYGDVVPFKHNSWNFTHNLKRSALDYAKELADLLKDRIDFFREFYYVKKIKEMLASGTDNKAKVYLAEQGMVSGEYESREAYLEDAFEWVESFALEDTDFMDAVGFRYVSDKEYQERITKLVEDLKLA